jgi:hypothetical protein
VELQQSLCSRRGLLFQELCRTGKAGKKIQIFS